MSNVFVDESVMSGWADIIREKNGIEDKMPPAVLLEKTNELKGAGEDYGVQLLNKTITEIPQSWKDITEIKNYAFFECAQLLSVDFPNAETIGQSAFNGCTNVKSVSLPKCTNVGDMAFANNENLETVYMPSLEHFSPDNTTSNNCLNCKKLRTFIAPLLKTAGDNAFRNCNVFVDIDFPLLERVSQYMFYECEQLKKVYFPSVIDVQASAFYYCYALTLAILPSATSLASRAFYRTSLDTLVLGAPSICSMSKTDALSNTQIASGTGYIYVPKALIEDYKVATNWTTYADQIRAIEDYRETLEPIFLENEYEYDWGTTE